jgi:2-hydroxy-6-oxonona-2,4-dienedioate hydrolase
LHHAVPAFPLLKIMSQFKEPLYSQSYIDTGTGHPVILLHGLFGNVAKWRQTINTLRSDHRVIVPRWPLYDVPIHRANVKYFVEVLHDFLDWHQLKNVTLIGTDIGGQIALFYAHAYPDRVKGIVLSGSSGLFENLPALDREYDKHNYAVHSKVKEAFFSNDHVNPNLVDKIYHT